MSQNPPVISPKKLIEVALPLDAINVACAREKSIRHGHPSTLHLWWARRPLAAARAVLFAQLVNDPGYNRQLQHGVNKEKAAAERERLFGIIRELVKWENTNNEDVLRPAREEIWKSWRETCALNKQHPQAAELFNPDKLPAFHDPFAGGGTIPLEAQRLGLESHASDLNPVAVLINKAMIEIPPKFAGRAPVGPPLPGDKPKLVQHEWPGATGLAEDVRRYGHWMREEAFKRIGHLYPPVEITAEMAVERPDLKPLVGQKLTVIAWLWARTVKSPNPAFAHVDVPLASTFTLANKPGKEAYVEPVVNADSYRFTVKTGTATNPVQTKNGTKAGGARGNFLCLLSNSPIDGRFIKAEAQAGRMGTRLMAVVAEGKGGRIYLSPTREIEDVARQAEPNWRPDVEFFEKALGFRIGNYGLKKWDSLFTERQLVALVAFSDLAQEVILRARQDAVRAGFKDDNAALAEDGTGATAYGEAIGVLLSFAVSRQANYSASLCVWSSHPKDELTKQVFLRQALSLTWDFAEGNPFSTAGGTLSVNFQYLEKAIRHLPAYGHGMADQFDAQRVETFGRIVSTDPPYYDNVGYADLSDFFYVWLRRSLRRIYPSLFATVAVPKLEELVATADRHGGKSNAEKFFLNGMTGALGRLAVQSHPGFPVTIYYAFRASETVDEGTASTGWETFLDAVLSSGFAISGTWPMRTEYTGNLKTQRNALASSIVLVCRKRDPAAKTVSRREFIRELNAVLPDALDDMTRGAEHPPVAPVDLSQAIIGPGMAVFSQYAAVLEADGTPMTVRTALQLINRFLAEDDFDADTQFCLHWFEQYGWETGKFGEADTLARAKGTSVEGVKQSGVLHASGGNVRLLKWAEYPSDWDPQADQRLPIWEVLHQLISVFNTDGETGAAAVFAAVQSKAEAARQLAYRLYTLCERKNWAEDARAYNEVVTSWSGIESAASREPAALQRTLFG